MFPRLNNIGSRCLAASLAFCIAMVVNNPSLWAQALSGVNGTVTDTAGGVIEGAKVTVTSNATDVTKTALTSSAGTYTVTDLLPGRYTVTVDMTGFQSSVHSGVGVEVGKVSTVDAEMQTGSTTQTVEVRENVIALDTTAPSLNTTIENKVVQELPNRQHVQPPH
jgi:hypothetical protein